MDRFDKFTDRARQALTDAQAAAARFDQAYIGPEHLLLGMIGVEDDTGAKVLVNLGAELPKVRTAVEFLIDAGDRPRVGEVGLTPAAKRVIELAIDEARRMEHRYLGTEHLLLGILRQGDSVAASVLESLGVTLADARHEVLRLAPIGSDQELDALTVRQGASETLAHEWSRSTGRMGSDDCSHALLVAINAYMNPLTRGLGHDQVAFAALVASFENCAERWATEPLVPRSLAHLCASLPAILTNSANGYRSDRRQAIYGAAATLDELVIHKVLPWQGPPS